MEVGMKKIMLVAVVLVLVAGAALPVLAQEMKTIRGEVIDLACYATAGAKGADHQKCAVACLELGEPAAILEDGTGKIYTVISANHSVNPSKNIAPYAAKMVEVTGKVSEKNGITVIDVTTIKEVQ